MSALKKGLSTSRTYAIKLENDIRDVEHSLKIQKQKQGMNEAKADNSENLLLGDSPSCILMFCPFKFGCPYSLRCVSSELTFCSSP
jgi:hypothetical protein